MVLALVGSAAGARVLVSQDEALALAFPAPARIHRRTIYLTPDQVAAARAQAGEGNPIESAMVVRYEGWRDGTLVGVGYVQTMLIRTLPASVFFVVNTAGLDGKPLLSRVEILSWGEPPEYLPRPGWTGQLAGKPLDGDLSLKKAIRPITGATLTSHALTDGARRTLAVHAVIPIPEKAP